jgi:hypothetical protein
MATVWIVYYGDNPIGSHNNPAGAAKLATLFQKGANFFENPNLEFGTKADFPWGDLGSSQVSLSIVMDDGRQFNAHFVIDREVDEEDGL